MKRLFAGLLSVWVLFGQEAGWAETFQLKDGRTLKGTVKRESADFYILKEDNGADTVLLKSKIEQTTASEGDPAAPPSEAAEPGIQPGSEWRSSPVVSKAAEEAPREASGPDAPAETEAAAATAVEKAAPASTAFPWFDGTRGYNQAMKEQALSGDPIVLYFYTNWCRYCKIFKKDVLNSVRVNDALKSAPRVSLNGDQERDLMAKYGIRGYPTFLVVPKRGTPKQINTGLGKEEFLKACADAGLKIRR